MVVLQAKFTIVEVQTTKADKVLMSAEYIGKRTRGSSEMLQMSVTRPRLLPPLSWKWSVVRTVWEISTLVPYRFMNDGRHLLACGSDKSLFHKISRLNIRQLDRKISWKMGLPSKCRVLLMMAGICDSLGALYDMFYQKRKSNGLTFQKPLSKVSLLLR